MQAELRVTISHTFTNRTWFAREFTIVGENT